MADHTNIPQPGELERRGRELLVGVITTSAEHLLGEAVAQAPVDEGTLRGSGNVEVQVTPAGVVATVSFDTPYAARQHEEVTWEHPKGGKAKYLEDPLKANAGRYERVMAQAAALAFRGS